MDNKIFENDKIFLAGANGMAGSAIYRSLIRKNYGNPILGGKIFKPRKTELDLLNSDEVNKWISKNKPNVVIIAAARVGGILANSNYPTEFILENIKIQTNIIEASWRFGVRRLLFLGSSCIYPKFAIQPINEDQLLKGKLEETNEMYAIAKIAGIKLCEALRTQYNFDAISLMPTNLYGPGDNYNLHSSHVFAALIKKFYEASFYGYKNVSCWGDGSPLREFLHVDDLGDAVVFSLEKWDPSNIKTAPCNKNNKPYLYLNVGTGKVISIKNLAIKISNEFKFKGNIIWDKTKPNGTPIKQLDISNIKKIGWQSKISLNEGINKTAMLYKDLHK